jgi:hypothetical protein
MIHNEPDPTTTEFDVTTRGSHTAECRPIRRRRSTSSATCRLSDTVAVRASAGYERLAGFTNAVSVAEITANAQPVLADPERSPAQRTGTFMQQQRCRLVQHLVRARRADVEAGR